MRQRQRQVKRRIFIKQRNAKESRGIEMFPGFIIIAFGNKCPHCEKTILGNGEYCSHCGKRIKE